MATKERKFSDLLNIELSRISAALSIAGTILAEMPASQQKSQLLKLIDEAEKGYEQARKIANNISRAASQI